MIIYVDDKTFVLLTLAQHITRGNLIMKQAKEGMVVLCRANGNMEHDFVGRI
ncbi:hypothetical protein FC12_GL001260 [Lacticaseibacillus paracasei subsp. tolerans DSM 20258]|nr:hypothetical protein FC12_GL001260 [Lacticaseibacillus paracasei subsp. tolerans DSM 20258]